MSERAGSKFIHSIYAKIGLSIPARSPVVLKGAGKIEIGSAPHEVQLGAEPIDRFVPIAGTETVHEIHGIAEGLRARMAEWALWNVTSTATRGGVAEMLRSLVPYVRGLAIHGRWLVIGGNAFFFRITKREHHALHGSNGDGSPWVVSKEPRSPESPRSADRPL